MSGRKIIHIDMDAFYASVEQRDRAELRGRPVAVGGSPSGRGVVAAASYEARKFGVRSAMSSLKAKRLCPELIFIEPNFKKYHAVSEQIHAIFNEVTDLVEPLSLDEAYLDVTENRLGQPLAVELAKWLKSRIRSVTGLTASAGVGPNKLVAKIASDLRKPDGLVVIPPERVSAFLEELPVEKLWGVGPVTAARLHEMGIRTAGEIRARTVESMESEFGKYGPFLHSLSHGIDARPVVSDWDPKSRGTETTFEKDVTNLSVLLDVLRKQSDSLHQELKELDRPARTVTLKIRYSDFQTITRSRTMQQYINHSEQIFQAAEALLLNRTEAGMRPIRLIGVSISGFVAADEPIQLCFDLPML